MQTIKRLRRCGVSIGRDRPIGDATALMEHAGVAALADVDGDQP
jgi:hypothetical protein